MRPRHTIHPKNLLVGTWLALTMFAFTKDMRAGLIGLTLTPAFYFYFIYTLNCKNRLLTYISIFAVAGHGIGSIFFFINHKNYTYSGFSAIKDYDFNLVSFYWFYARVLLLFFLTAYLVKRKSYFTSCIPRNEVEFHSRVSTSHTIILVFFIFAFFIPLYVTLFAVGVGIQGVEIVNLPFKLTGLIYYGRLVLFPVFIFYLYKKAGSSTFSMISIIVFAFVAGVTSASRMAFLMSSLPVVFDAVNNLKKTRSLLILLFIFVGVQTVSLAREFLYFGSEKDLIFIFTNAITLLFSSESDSLITVFGYIMNRFYGAQDIVLASQHSLSNPIVSTFSYFLSGGEMGAVVPNLNESIFGVELSGESENFGLGLGTFTILYMLFCSNIFAGFIGVYLLALLIRLGDGIIRKFSVTRYPFSVNGLDKILLMVAAFYLYSSSLNLAFYLFLLLFLASKLLGRSINNKAIKLELMNDGSA